MLDATIRRCTLQVACAVEMIHTYSLIHDDLPAWIMMISVAENRQTIKYYGEALAVLAGDALQTLAFGSISNDLRILLPEQRIKS